MYCIVFYCFIPHEIGLNFLIQRFFKIWDFPIFRAYLLTIFKGLSAAHWSYMSIAKGALKLSVILHIMNVTTIRTNTIHKFTARWPNDHLFKIHQKTRMYFHRKQFFFIYIFELHKLQERFYYFNGKPFQQTTAYLLIFSSYSTV